MSSLFQRPFRGRLSHVLAGSAVLVITVFVAMAVALSVSLGEAGTLLNRLNRSQDQLAIVTQIQGEIGRLQSAQSEKEVDRLDGQVSGKIADYRRSIAAETEHLDQSALEGQSLETVRAIKLANAFDALRGSLEGTPSPLTSIVKSANVRSQISQIDTLAEEIIAKERSETQHTIAAMRSLRQSMTILGVAIPVAGALVVALGAWLIALSIAGPLRKLHEAAERAGRGESIAPVEVEGFSDFESLAAAFSHMDEQISTQRTALADANKGLEAQVEERTREIEASRRQLADVDQNRRQFYAQIAHELRTPITVMLGETEVALRDKSASPEQLKEALQHVAANGSFLQRRLQDMLALARADDGRLIMRKSPIELGSLLRQTAALAEPYVRSSGSQLVADLPPGAGPSISGDATWLQQSLLALIDNAAKFSRGEGAIQLACDFSEERARITVSDSGSGVSSDELPRLFETYYQTKEGRRRGGSGLGMSVAKWVVEQHGGSIGATSAPGRGLTVQIELPASS